jgi:hypothetical protein
MQLMTDQLTVDLQADYSHLIDSTYFVRLSLILFD